MKFAACVLFIALIPFIFSDEAEEECGENKVWKCEHLCIRTCDTLNIRFKCKEGCNEGCWCKEGYFFEHENSTKCIKENKCHSWCDPEKNEVYYDWHQCGCKEKDDTDCSECQPGCKCSYGYKRNDEGNCVKEE